MSSAAWIFTLEFDVKSHKEFVDPATREHHSLSHNLHNSSSSDSVSDPSMGADNGGGAGFLEGKLR